jgi:hypothetical protein
MRRLFAGALLFIYASCQAGDFDLPTAHELGHGKDIAVTFIDEYRLGKIGLACTLPTGSSVGIVLVKDKEDFRFFAMKLQKGAAILANENELKREWPPYAVYSFYRECALHVMSKVTARTIEDSDRYTISLIRAAECLAVIPTLGAFTNPREASVARISLRLREEYGDRQASSRIELERCQNAKYSAEVAAREMRR